MLPGPGARCDRERRSSRSHRCRLGQREQARAAAAAERREREEQARLRCQEIDRCPLCDADGYVVESTGVRVCFHDPEAAERANRGADQCRRVLSEATA
ncbi:hypothetical protein GCM10025864_25070 [Luteimicrobium album]|uniref:Uncharacterized protein n=1 Tax=Luteimicrobium album TaxID=1054550 RepID=A0ABQ6I1V4_9MICO|nr:hypothetical protein GCM10025864_25070 [Luteimicrobium album]